MISLIANIGIQMFTFPIKFDPQDNVKMFFHEWLDPEKLFLKLELVQDISTESGVVYVKKYDLYNAGFLSADTSITKLKWDEVSAEGIKPLKMDADMCEGVRGNIFRMNFSDRNCKLSFFENVWLPIPYFLVNAKNRFRFGPLNWSRFKLVPRAEENEYDVILAFDTRSYYGEGDEYNEGPVFADNYQKELTFSVCENDFLLADYCAGGKPWSYIDNYLMQVVYPDATKVNRIRVSQNDFKYSYIATYIYLIKSIVRQNLFPKVTLYKDRDVTVKDIDMIIDVGNSRTTALLVEDNMNFNQVRPLELIDYTDIIMHNENGMPQLKVYKDPFDMHLAFRKAQFGNIGIKDSLQFVYPSLVRLGIEANNLARKAADYELGRQSYSTYSSPKRYLWDDKKQKYDWEFVRLPNESQDDSVLILQGITSQLNADGSINAENNGGVLKRYPRRSLMTFAFLEMFVQARFQINSHAYREFRGETDSPRRIRRVIVTCPTAMSKIEREALINSAKDAALLLKNFSENKGPQSNNSLNIDVTIVPKLQKTSDKWYYDEATCAQLVYMYAEMSQRYNCHCEEFFHLYGRKREDDLNNSLIVGSLDIGAGTSDLMICKYDYKNKDIVKLVPSPLFYDSYYYAGDDMLKMLILNLIIQGEHSMLCKYLRNISSEEYHKKIYSFFGPDHNEQSFTDRLLRRDFNLQVSVPLISYFLELLSKGTKRCAVRYEDVFSLNQPSPIVLESFKRHFGFDFEQIEWIFDPDNVSVLIERAFEPLLKKIAAIMYAYSCDIIVLSGRPTSLPPIEKIFLKYYPVSPNRLVLLNKYHIGTWYPFNDGLGYMTSPKTVVSVGAMIGHYSTDLANLKNFSIDTTELGKRICSTANFLLNPNPLNNKEHLYILTPSKRNGELVVNSLPVYIEAKQIDSDLYPARVLFCIDFDDVKIAKLIESKYDDLSTSKIEELVEERKHLLKQKLPFTFKIEKVDSNNERENIEICEVSNSEQEDITPFFGKRLTIHSLGVSNCYWLDSGAFEL